MARSGVEGAIGILRSDDASYDAMKDTWAMDFPAIEAGEGALQVKMVDEEGKIAINRLVESNGVDVNKDVEDRLRSLIERLGGKPEIVDALIDWMDVNDDIAGTAGAAGFDSAFTHSPQQGPTRRPRRPTRAAGFRMTEF
jgi:general secretion pathway protein K